MKTAKRRSAFLTAVIVIVTVILLGTMIAMTFIALNDNKSPSDISDADSSIVDITDSDPSVTVSDVGSEPVSDEDVSDEVSEEISDVIADVSDEVSEDVSQDEEEELFHGWIINRYGYTYVYNDTGLVQFNYKNTAMDRYVNSLNSLAELLPENVNIFNMLAPVHSTFIDIPQEIYVADNFYNASQTAFVSVIEKKLNERIKDIPIIGKLERRYDDGQYIFFRTDNNWTPLAAYYAYCEFCEAKGISAYSRSSFITRSIEGYLGSFYNATGSVQMADNPDAFEYYYPYAGVDCTLVVDDNGIIYTSYRLSGNEVTSANAYNVFLGMDAATYTVTSSAEGGAILVIGDSSVPPIMPFLASHYSTVYYVNPLEYNGNISDYISDKSIDDVLTMCYTTNAVSGDYVPSFNIVTGATAVGE